ncbi:MAG: flagellar basal body P-ring formation protein FlgA [Planctomycetota bacterium]|nr:MAG: flagellar basal body P-ring formation protein FlgA [Planctomycetota bacterium]
MNSKAVSIILVTCLVTVLFWFRETSANSAKTSEGQDYALQVYLPREVTIEGETANLGQVGIIRGKKFLATKASKIALGRLSVAGQEIVLDRQMVLSRLACSGIPSTEVTLTGAEKVTIRQQQKIIKSDRFVEQASSFLKVKLPADSVCPPDPMRTLEDMVVPETSEEIELVAGLVPGARNQAKVQISVFADGKKVGTREVAFRLKYKCRRAAALVDIPAGALISPENVKIEECLCDNPEPPNWRAPYGLVARRGIPANSILRPSMVRHLKPDVIVKRNQNVVIRMERPGFSVSAIGKAMQKGSVGEYVKVRNVDSQRVILAKVNEDGTVEPVF